MKNEPVITTIEGKPFNATWLITAPWAHPLWSQYALLLTDLTTPIGTPPVIHLDGATHEVLLYALDPKYPIANVQVMIAEKQFHPLNPPNHGYQFKAESDDAAVVRLQEVVDQIEARRLSPDTDLRLPWNLLFRDGHSLLRRS